MLWFKIILVIIVLAGSINYWFAIYGLCLAFNGASGKGFRDYYWRHLKEEFFWAMPGGWKRRLAFCKQDGYEPYSDWKTREEWEEECEELAKTLPGLPSFLFSHFCIPFGPTVLLLISFYFW